MAEGTAAFYEGLSDLPAFNPDDDRDPLPDAVAELRQLIADSDALLFCTPEYAGTLPGSFKNLLDWTVGGSEIGAKPVAWINVAAAGRGDGATSTLAAVLNYVDAAVIDSACQRISIGRADVDHDDHIEDADIRARLADVVAELEASLGVPFSA